LAVIPPGGSQNRGFQSWDDMGLWQAGLARGRRDVSPEIKQKVAALTASATTPLEKMRAIASFAQREIRYVGLELGIGGYQPHPAPQIFAHRYGDCKDEATLVSAGTWRKTICLSYTTTRWWRKIMPNPRGIYCWCGRG